MAIESANTQTAGIHVWLLLWKATRAVGEHARQSVRRLGLGLSDFGVLEALLHKGPLPVNELGKKVLLTSGAMTAAVDRLERRGLVERINDAMDRRKRVIRLTIAGGRFIRERFSRHEQDMERAVSCLAPPERRRLAALLRKLGLGADALLRDGQNKFEKGEEK